MNLNLTFAKSMNLNLNLVFFKVNEFEFEFSFIKVNEFEFEFSFFEVNEFEFEFENHKKMNGSNPDGAHCPGIRILAAHKKKTAAPYAV